MTEAADKPSTGANFRRFFLRGLGILLPSVLTIWILIAAYQFVQQRIAGPINAGVREGVLRFTPYPEVSDEQLLLAQRDLSPEVRRQWEATGQDNNWLRFRLRRQELHDQWLSYSFPLDLIGLIIAVVAIYLAGALLGSYVGHSLYRRGEALLQRVPLIKQVYPSVKQITDFFVGSDPAASRANFSRVVALEYPRKGMWSIGLVTGETMRAIESAAGDNCLTVFVPSSPTPFTGYVVTVMARETVDLPISIDDALRFTISGGVIIPPSQMITANGEVDR